MKKKLLSVLSAVLLMTLLLTGTTFTSAAVSDDPADTYVKQNAAAEDPTLDMWFQHSFVKTARGDNTSTGRDTYSVYMAKNETESAQVVLSSSVGHKGLTVSLTDFTDGKGNTIPAEIYREFYIGITGVNTSNYYGASEGNIGVRTDIEQPEVVVPNSESGAFNIDAGMTQAFLIRLTSATDTPSGWYSAQFTVRQSPVTGGVIDFDTYSEIKTATVYAYVWNFEMSDKTELQTSVFINGIGVSEDNYKLYYDYLLDNRICGMQVPGTLSADNEYVHDPRVSAFCVTKPGSKNYPSNDPPTGDQIANLYADFSAQSDWEEIKDKAYFYFNDEPMPENHGHCTVDDVGATFGTISSAWPDPYIVVPYEYNTAYPAKSGAYTETIASLYASGAEIKDSTQKMMDDGSVTVWCPRIYDMTPISELKRNGYNGAYESVMKNSDCMLSGNIWIGEQYFDWTQKYGDFGDRVRDYVAQANADGKPTKLWMYLAGRAGGYTYPNILIENTGLQTKMYFWQSYQEDTTGFLYYGSNFWTEYKDIWENANPGVPFATTMTETYYDARAGSTTYGQEKTSDVAYQVNKFNQNNGLVYGNGVLFYNTSVGTKLYRCANGVSKSTPVVGTVRVEIMRDGIEDYQMLKMYEGAAGADAAKAYVAKISDNVVNYASLKNFSLTAHGWDASMTADDAVAANRVALGNALEEKLGTPDVPVIVKGDVNGDGNVDNFDIIILKRFIIGKVDLTDECKAAVDVKPDGRINIFDLIIIKRAVLGLITLG